MKKEELKYEKAWDNKTKQWITPEQVSKSDSHDRNRYFSEPFEDNEDKGRVLTIHKESKPITSKKGTKFTRKAHFCSIANNTRKYRDYIAKKAEHQESLVHELCKEEIRNINFIKVPCVEAKILDEDIQVVNEQYIRVIKVKHTEKQDSSTGRIPDAVIEVEILGKIQEMYVEFYYKHEVDENKRKQYQHYKYNCIEVDLSELRDNLEESDKSIRKKINNIISEKAYWISCRAKEIIERDAQKEFVIELSKENELLNDTKYYNKNELSDLGWYAKRLYAFKDNIKENYNIDETHPCYFVKNPDLKYTQYEKCINIGQCMKCNNCIFISNYFSEKTDKTKVYCKVSGDKKRINPVELVKNIYNKMLDML